MFLLWRSFVVWLRGLLISLVTKQPIDWHKKIDEALDIAKNVNDKVTPVNAPVVTPDYDIIGPVEKKTPLRDFFKKLRKKQ